MPFFILDILMKYAIIDIGSNSVRLMFHDGVNTLSKHVITTRLAENMSVNNELSAEAIERTVSAVSLFYKKAVEEGCEKIMAFATAAVRKATNKQVSSYCKDLKYKYPIIANV